MVTSIRSSQWNEINKFVQNSLLLSLSKTWKKKSLHKFLNKCVKCSPPVFFADIYYLPLNSLWWVGWVKDVHSQEPEYWQPGRKGKGLWESIQD